MPRGTDAPESAIVGSTFKGPIISSQRSWTIGPCVSHLLSCKKPCCNWKHSQFAWGHRVWTASSSSWSAPRLENGQRSRRGQWPSCLVSVLSVVAQHETHFKTTFWGGRMEEVHGGLPRFKLPVLWNNLQRADFDFGHSSKSIFRVTELGFLLASNIQIKDPAIGFSQGAKYKLMGTATIQLRIAQHQIDDHLCLMIVGRSWALMQTVKVSELQEGGAATNCASSKDSFGGCTWRQPCQCPRFIKPTCLSVTAYANNLITKNYISKHLCRMQEELVSVSRRIEESWISPGDGSL